MSLIKHRRCYNKKMVLKLFHNTAQGIDVEVKQEVGIRRASVRTPVLHQESLHTLVTTLAFFHHLHLSAHSNREVLEQSLQIRARI